MERRNRAALLFGAACLVALSTGCSLQQLKSDNLRLRQANDRLVSENNRLGQERTNLEKELSEKKIEIARLRDELDRKPTVRAETPKAEDFYGHGVESERTSDGTLIRLDAAVFFPLGQASLSGEGKRILSRVSRSINRSYPRNVIRVEGHTDDLPVRKVKHLYPTNWELSTARACSVVRYLVGSGGVNPNRIYPAGYSHYRPRVAGTSSTSRSKNRRVEILILDRRA